MRLKSSRHFLNVEDCVSPSCLVFLHWQADVGWSERSGLRLKIVIRNACYVGGRSVESKGYAPVIAGIW